MKDDFLEEYREGDLHSEMVGGKTIELRGRSFQPFKIFLLVFVIFFVLGIFGLGVYGYFLYQKDLPPKVSEVSIFSSNEDRGKAVYGDKITLRFTFNEKIYKDPVVIINDKKVEVYQDEKGYYSTYFIQDQSAKDVIVEFEIKDYQDIFGKVGKSVSETTDHSSVLIPSYLTKEEKSE